MSRQQEIRDRMDAMVEQLNGLSLDAARRAGRDQHEEYARLQAECGAIGHLFIDDFSMSCFRTGRRFCAACLTPEPRSAAVTSTICAASRGTTDPAHLDTSLPPNARELERPG